MWGFASEVVRRGRVCWVIGTDVLPLVAVGSHFNRGIHSVIRTVFHRYRGLATPPAFDRPQLHLQCVDYYVVSKEVLRLFFLAWAAFLRADEECTEPGGYTLHTSLSKGVAGVFGARFGWQG